MTMPDAIQALLALAQADEAKLTRHVYNLGSFSPSAGEFLERGREYFPDAQVSFEPDQQRQAIVDSWPEDVDDSAARRDWGYAPQHDLGPAFADYLVPRIKGHYAHNA